ncbi:unnamed protein product [Adineta steineri]|uniref:Uncharacterized protein n=1 Tax=Adineta steineri TaxID=433720 RepID=A0A819MI61_9BILA|nr:unnamed protein product [Adineta steineri]CAF3981217.1 unnamed protein product [Adineta steineri]
MKYRQSFDSPSGLASTAHASHSLINRNAWADDDDINRIHQKKTSFAWTSFFKCCFVGLLLAGIGLAIVLTFWLTSKTTATETLASTMGITSTSTSTTSTSTSTTTTETTTTTAATASITSNTCTSGWTGVTILYHCTSCPTIYPNAYYSYTYVAIANLTRISLVLREDVGCFAIDNVSVRSTAAPSVELISNNGFETGNLSSWTYCNPGGASVPGAGEVFNSLLCISLTLVPKSGSYFYCDGVVGYNDYLSQTFTTVIGQLYNVSFWLSNDAGNNNGTSAADILLSV